MIAVDVQGRAGNFASSVAFESAGDVTAVFGPSGCGKTTLIRMICGLHTPERGQIRVGDTLLYDQRAGLNVPAHKRRLGVVFQEPRLFPHLGVTANLRYGQWAGGRSSPLSFDDVVDLLGLGALLQRRTAFLSGGERQRVAIGRALLAGPRLLVMDEPLASLDAARKAEILPYLVALKAEIGIPMLYVSHSLSEIEQLATDMVVMTDGRVVTSGALDEVLNRLDVPGFSEGPEAGSRVKGRLIAHDEDTATGRIAFEGQQVVVPLPRPRSLGPVLLHIQAKDVIIALEPPRGLSIRNQLSGKIAALHQPAGPYVEVLVQVGAQQVRARITQLAARDLQLDVGQSVYVLIKSVALEPALG
ncbi:molybdenum ABC transporter ATP-binding protein [Pseudovibrio exalbescens]|uniref:Uncharacterized protein n=1 Tax=Pseudovibrio exalbescens TaxID=197461 RepID=A0A1U7JGQ7_9HYPH|nr:molybdenum ABC transporter ATP-binding protein [Pseudovibrio exalbescens]OKL43907.1 hypothetical protein A3843_09905 [Pseudovibrio exalbescens]